VLNDYSALLDIYSAVLNISSAVWNDKFGMDNLEICEGVCNFAAVSIRKIISTDNLIHQYRQKSHQYQH